jgi:phosphatidylinositol alpha-1,6-mannosyltransferase
MHPREREKGHYELLAVWPEIVKKFPDAQLVFAGSGEDQDHIAQVARDRGVGDSAFVPGDVPHPTLMKLYAKCYAFTMPSRQEGFGLVFLEAMNFAKPCLGCRDGGAEDVIVDQETGLLINNPVEERELAGALRQLLGDPERAGEMGSLGFARLHEQFTAAHVQRRMREQLETVL